MIHKLSAATNLIGRGFAPMFAGVDYPGVAGPIPASPTCPHEALHVSDARIEQSLVVIRQNAPADIAAGDEHDGEYECDDADTDPATSGHYAPPLV